MGFPLTELGVSLTIRNIAIEHGLALAPMEGVTDVSFRRLVRKVGGCGLFCTEFIPARGLVEDHAMVRRMAELDDDEHPVTIQVFGRDPALLADGARVAQDLGADIVDLNMGCPSKKVCAHSGGSALMKEPALVAQIVRAMRAAVEVPFTVKMRAGWDPDHRNAPELARLCESEGAEAVTVHWRTRTDGYGGERTWHTVAEVKDAVSIPVLANGDVVDAATAREALEATGADGVMIGRGAIRNPWVFHEIAHALHGAPQVVPDAAEKERVLLAYFDEILDRFDTDRGALGRWKGIGKYFVDGLEQGDRVRTAFLRSRSVTEARAHVEAYFDCLRRFEAGDPTAFDALEVSAA